MHRLQIYQQDQITWEDDSILSGIMNPASKEQIEPDDRARMVFKYLNPADDVWYLDELDIDDGQAVIIASELRCRRPSTVYLNDNRSLQRRHRLTL